MALHFPDFRASERTFQLITQVAGRTGRGSQPGQVIVQTFSPDHPAVALAKEHDFLGFAAQELGHREKFGYPPFGSMARIIIRGPLVEPTESFANQVGVVIKKIREQQGASEVHVLGPAPLSDWKASRKLSIPFIASRSRTSDTKSTFIASRCGT